MIPYDSSYSDIYKFNDGYFIQSLFQNENLSDTIANTTLIKERQTLAANTYAYKLVGPMYLKVTLNHIQNFDYNIYGTKEDNTATIWVEGFLTYNCPDSDENSTVGGNNDENYYTYEEVKPSFNGFDLFINDSVEVESPSKSEKETSKYNPDSNLYTVKITKGYTIENINTIPDNILNFVLGVNSPIDNVYLKGLSVKSFIDLSLLGSGKIQIKGWKFFNNLEEEITLITFMLEAYPEYGKSFKDLTITFTNIQDTTKTFDYKIETVLNGRQTISIPWSEDTFQKSCVYNVSMSYTTSDDEKLSIKDLEGDIYNETFTLTNSNSTKISEETSTRWILISDLFNDFYNDADISDFCKTTDSDFQSKMTIQLTPELFVNDKSNQEDTEYNGSLISADSSIQYTATNTYNLEYEFDDNSKITILNETSYPIISSQRENNLEFNNSQLVIDSQISYTGNYSGGSFDYLVTQKNLSLNDNKLKGEITYINKYQAQTANTIQTLNNIFVPLSTVYNKLCPNNETGGYCGAYVEYDSRNLGKSDGHFLDVVINKNKIARNPEAISTASAPYQMYKGPDDSKLLENCVRLDDQWTDSTVKYVVKHYSDSIFQEFNRGTNNSLAFTGVTILWNSYGDTLPRGGYWSPWYNWKDNAESPIHRAGYITSNHTFSGSSECTRKWWKTPTGWAIFPHAGYKPKQNLVYCAYNDNSKFNNLKLYATTDVDEYRYTNKYSVDVTAKINFKYNQTKKWEIVLPQIGNLQFTLESSDKLTLEKNYSLQSSQKFYDEIQLLQTETYSNIYYNSETNIIRLSDNNGNPLNPYVVYERDNNDLLVQSKYTDKLFVDSSSSGRDGINLLLYNGNTFGTPQYRYNLTGHDGDCKTYLDFQGIQIVDENVLSQDNI